MFYVSTVKDGVGSTSANIGVTDTADGVEEFYSAHALAEIIDSGVVIYGAYVWNHAAECTVLRLNRRFDWAHFTDLCRKSRELHNPWTLYPIRDYLATLKIGVEFKILSTTVDRGVTEHSRLWLKKIGVDLWEWDNGYLDNSKPCNSNYAETLVDIVLSFNFKVRTINQG